MPKRPQSGYLANFTQLAFKHLKGAGIMLDAISHFAREADGERFTSRAASAERALHHLRAFEAECREFISGQKRLRDLQTSMDTDPLSALLVLSAAHGLGPVQWGGIDFGSAHDAALGGGGFARMDWERAIKEAMDVRAKHAAARQFFAEGKWYRFDRNELHRRIFLEGASLQRAFAPDAYPTVSGVSIREGRASISAGRQTCLISQPRLLQAPDADLLATSRNSSAPTHAEDFTSVDWYGTRFKFSKGLQAEVVRVLWKVWQDGHHGLSEKTIGANAGSNSERFRIAHVFRKHEAFKTMIRPSGKGVYCLVPPEITK